MIERPILFLDVDGVINAVPPRDDAETTFMAGGFRISVPLGTRDRIGHLSDVYDVVWATAWRGAAHVTFRECLNLPQESWPYLDWHDLKLPQALRYAGERPWAWVDDDADWELRRLGWDRDTHVSGLIVTPETSLGMTDDHTDQLLEYARGS